MSEYSYYCTHSNKKYIVADGVSILYQVTLTN